MKLYRIARWDDLYENSRTRTMKTMQWAPIPNKLDGDGYTELIDHTDGPTHYGCWVTLVLVASRCTPRGVLVRANGQPHSPTTLTRLTRISPTVIEATIERVIKIGWLQEVTAEEVASSQTVSLSVTERKERKERNGTEDSTYGTCSDQSSQTGSEPSEYEFPTTGRTERWRLPQAKLLEYRQSYPNLDVDSEIVKARQWCRDNPRRRKTAGRGMLSFLTSWLNRTTNNTRGSPGRFSEAEPMTSLEI